MTAVGAVCVVVHDDTVCRAVWIAIRVVVVVVVVIVVVVVNVIIIVNCVSSNDGCHE